MILLWISSCVLCVLIGVVIASVSAATRIAELKAEINHLKRTILSEREKRQ
jgi:flagellar biosynthesis protein FliQ